MIPLYAQGLGGFRFGPAFSLRDAQSMMGGKIKENIHVLRLFSSGNNICIVSHTKCVCVRMLHIHDVYTQHAHSIYIATAHIFPHACAQCHGQILCTVKSTQTVHTV